MGTKTVTTYICDKCDRDMKGPNSLAVVKTKWPLANTQYVRELCYTCVNRLKEWFNE